MRYVIVLFVALVIIVFPVSTTSGASARGTHANPPSVSLTITGTIVETAMVDVTVVDNVLTIRQPIKASAILDGVKALTIRLVSGGRDVEVKAQGGRVVWLPSSEKRVVMTVLP